jgi:hypothetical protein
MFRKEKSRWCKKKRKSTKNLCVLTGTPERFFHGGCNDSEVDCSGCVEKTGTKIGTGTFPLPKKRTAPADVPVCSAFLCRSSNHPPFPTPSSALWLHCHFLYWFP